MIFVWLCVPDQFNRNIHLIMNSTSKHVQKIQKRQDGGTMVILIFQLKFMFCLCKRCFNDMSLYS